MIQKKCFRIDALTKGLAAVSDQLKQLQQDCQKLPSKEQLASAKKERDQAKDEYLQSVEARQELAQENQRLKAKIQQQQVDKIAAIYHARPNAQQQEEHDVQVRHLEARVQRLTEDNDELRRDLELAKREMEEN